MKRIAESFGAWYNFSTVDAYARRRLVLNNESSWPILTQDVLDLIAGFEAERQRLLITQHMHFVDPIVLGRRKAAIVTMYGQTPALPTAISSLLRVRASGGGL